MVPLGDEFSRVERALTASDLDEVERFFGFRFPPTFRAHYLAVNGGHPRRYLFRTEECIYVLHDFLPIKYGSKGTLFEDVYRDLKIEREVLPKHLVAFAEDPGGDFYCFSVREEDGGTIWFYQGEFAEEPDRAVQFLSASLMEFLGEMTEDEE